MVSETLNKALKTLFSRYPADIDYDVSLAGKNSIRIGGIGSVWYKPESVNGLSSVISFLNDKNIKWKIVGNGSNILFPDGRSEIFYTSLEKPTFNKVEIKENMVHAGAGTFLSRIISETAAKGLSGFESLAGIPGTIGGAIKMNASYRSSISEILEKILILDGKGSLSWLKKDDLKFAYRKIIMPEPCVILEAVFNLKERDPVYIKKVLKKNVLDKISKQPLEARTLGCTFKNPKNMDLSSGQIIDNAGLKGFSCGDAYISEKHANFIINRGNATSGDVMRLIELITKKVKQKYGILLEVEIDIF